MNIIVVKLLPVDNPRSRHVGWTFKSRSELLNRMNVCQSRIFVGATYFQPRWPGVLYFRQNARLDENICVQKFATDKQSSYLRALVLRRLVRVKANAFSQATAYQQTPSHTPTVVFKYR